MKKLLNITKLLKGTSAILMASVSLASAADFPTRNITVIVPFGAGGAADMHARTLQPLMSKILDTNVVVKNVGGGGGTIGTAQAAASRADGYTLLYAPVAPITVQPQLRNIPYNYDSFEPIARVASSPVTLISSKKLPFDNISDFIKDAKAHPNKYSYASVGAGTIPHIAMEAFTKATGIKMKHIPFRNGGEVMKALLAGQVDVCAELPHLASSYGLDVLTVFDDKKYPALPNIPTTAELGINLSYSLWMGYFAPKNTSQEKVKILENSIKTSLKDKNILEKMKNQHVDLAYLDGFEFKKFVEDDYNKNGKILEESGLNKK